jgi:hypothetical protein
MMVLEQDRKDALLQSMADESARKILLSTVWKAKTIHEISEENRIPISSCYRKVRELITLRLLRVEETIITDTGKKYELYRSAIKDAKVNFSSTELSVEVTLTPREPEDRLSTLWKSVRGDVTRIISAKD